MLKISTVKHPNTGHLNTVSPSIPCHHSLLRIFWCNVKPPIPATQIPCNFAFPERNDIGGFTVVKYAIRCVRDR